MKTLLVIFFASAICWSCANDKKEKAAPVKVDIEYDPSLITDSSWGAITKQTGYAELQKIFGAGNVKDERICDLECADSINVTKIYPEKNNEFIVYWKDSLYHKSIAFIETYLSEGPYHTANGLKIGSTLEELLKVNNGNQILFNGFDWDYGGFIQAYGGGPLENSPLGFRLMIEEDGGTEVSGDSEFNTEMPEVKKKMTKIKIAMVSLSFSKN
jgi:hypothetical protein